MTAGVHYHVIPERFSEALDEELKSDLDRIDEAGIPVDVKFRQGRDVLGLGLE